MKVSPVLYSDRLENLLSSIQCLSPGYPDPATVRNYKPRFVSERKFYKASLVKENEDRKYSICTEELVIPHG